MGHRHFNGLKTALLFGIMWAFLLALWAVVGQGSTGTLVLFCGSVSREPRTGTGTLTRSRSARCRRDR